MKNIGVICEYNPFHNGHAKQLRFLARHGAAVCLMSGNYVQRGEPALTDQWTRARAAAECGADLVLELPVTYALRSAEGFADGGVEILSGLGCVDALCFGSESGDGAAIMRTAELLLRPEFSARLREELDSGVSFPTARQRALEKLSGAEGNALPLTAPNDILAVEYCKALLRRSSAIEPLPLRREGCYHTGADPLNPSAAFLRTRTDWSGYMPEAAWEIFRAAPRYTVQAGERAWLARLRSMQAAEFEALPFGSEGLWRKVLAACRSASDIEEIVAAAKSKRYTRTRLMRLLLCAYLGISREMLEAQAPYVRALAANARGRAILKRARESGSVTILNPGETPPESAYAELERRAADLYGLFCEGSIGPCGAERSARFYTASSE